MMRNFFLYLFILVNTLSFATEDLIVIHVKGNIRSSLSPLKPGDKIDSETKLIFENSEASAVVMSTKRGRLVLSPTAKNTSTELAYVVDNILNPSTKQLSTRSGEILNMIDLKNHLAKDQFVILDSLIIDLSNSNLVLDGSHFFYLSYNFQGESINKKIPSSDGKLILTKQVISQVDNEPIDFALTSDHQLFYYKAQDKTRSDYGAVHFVFPNKEALQTEITLLTTILKENKASNEKIKEEILLYLNDAYGFVDKHNFETWINGRI